LFFFLEPITIPSFSKNSPPPAEKFFS
jgi:hypothetical protein